MQHSLVYDGSVAGYFTCVFEMYERKILNADIKSFEEYNQSLFGEPLLVTTSSAKAKRVITAFKRKAPIGTLEQIEKVLHAEQPDGEAVCLSRIRRIFDSKTKTGVDYRHDDETRIKRIVKMMNREIHRMHAFVRFQKTADELYAATVSPDFDVIPFIGEHFEKRYADEQWVIYDTKRDYGLFYDLENMQTIVLTNAAWMSNKQIDKNILATDEDRFQKMWATYFQSTCIEARKNMRLHLKHVPHRYWRYLPEKTRRLP